MASVFHRSGQVVGEGSVTFQPVRIPPLTANAVPVTTSPAPMA
jgi:hypothetical protein